MTRPEIKKEVTVGNIISIVASVIMPASAVFGCVWWFSGEFATIKSDIATSKKDVAELKTTVTNEVIGLKAADVKMIGERDIRRKATDDKFEIILRERGADRERLVRVEEGNRFILDIVKQINDKLDRVENRRP